MHPAALIKLNLTNAYPRAYVTRRIAPSGLDFGPFPSRGAADAFLAPFLDLFRIRRCQIKIRRDPSFPGCIYSEMKMRLAPCFAGCTEEEYSAESRALPIFLAHARFITRRRTGPRARSRQRPPRFRAGSRATPPIRKSCRRAPCVSEVARPLDDLNALVLQRAVEEDAELPSSWCAAGGPSIRRSWTSAEPATRPRSVEQLLRDILQPSARRPCEYPRSQRSRDHRRIRRPPGIAGAMVLRSPARGRDFLPGRQIRLALQPHPARLCAALGAARLNVPSKPSPVLRNPPLPARNADR